MYFEIVALAIIIFFALNFTGRISINRFVSDNEVYFQRLKENDWDFYVKARYGDKVNADFLFNKRIKNGLIVIIVMLCFFISNLTYITVLFSLLAGYLVFKLDYSNMKNYYKRHLHDIDAMLPHYLKSLEILIQHYTVPVALGKSINDAPGIFKEGLQQLINEVNAGDSSINPYMTFAKTYPVRDSMRMMRLLYRLGLGEQEKKHQQLVSFSKSVSSLQAKAREQKYQARLNAMERKTMLMMCVTGFGSLGLLLISIFMLMGSSM